MSHSLRLFRAAVTSLLITVLVLGTGMFGAIQKAQAVTIGNQELISLPIDQYNNTHQALLWLPDTYATDDPSIKYPLIINLHGAGDAGTDINKMLNPSLMSRLIADGFKPEAVNPIDGAKYKFIVVSPQHPWWSESYTQMKWMLPSLLANYRINPDRIYITGLSAGGQGSWTMVTDDATNAVNISAIAPMSAATLDSAQVPKVTNAATNNIGVWSVMGGADGFLTSTQDYTNRVNAANPVTPAKLTVLNSVGHSAWIEGFDDLWRVNGMNVFEWMLTNKRGTPNPTNALPSVSLTAPANNAVVIAPQDITLTATASDTDGSVAKVEFFNGKSLLATVNAAPYTYTWANPGVGTYAVFARVTDNTGAVLNSNTSRITILAQANQSAPFGGTVRTIPGKIQAEDYDIGGQGIAYNDSAAVNVGNWYRPYDGVDMELVPAEGADQYYVGWPTPGEWTKYTVNVQTTGTYTLQARVATPNTGKSFRIEMDGTTVATVPITASADWNTYQTISIPNVPLTAGAHVMRLYDVTDGFNLNWISFTLATNNQPPVANAGIDQTITLPTNSVTLTGSGTDSDGTITGYAWTKVSGSGIIATPSAATTNITGLTQGTSTFRLTVTDNNNVTAYDDVVITVVGQTTPTPYSGTPIAIPGTIQVEDYDNGGEGIAYHDLSSGNAGGSYRTTEGVDVEFTSYDNGYDLGWTNTGEWMKYTVNVQSTGTYAMQVRVATPNAGKSFSIDMDGTPLATVSVPNTGWWQTWQTTPAQNVSLTAGTHVMKVTILSGSPTDADGYNLNWISFTPVSPNNSPTANAGADQAITLPVSSVSLAGSGADSDGTIASYAWSQQFGPNTATIATASSASTNVSGLIAGSYRFRLTVTDNQGATGSDDVEVIVNPASNVAPTVSAGADKSITLPTNSVTLTGTATDPENTAMTYLWEQVSGPTATITSAAALSTTVTDLVQGTYTFKLTATDAGNLSASDTMIVTVSAAQNVAPTANAGTDQTITLPTNSVTLSGSGADTDGTIASYAWSVVSGSGAITSPTNASTSITGLTQGTSVFRLTVTDNDGATGTDDVTVVVNGAGNSAPTANAGTDQMITLPTNSVTLTGTGADSDGTIQSYAWNIVSGSGTITSPSSASTTITGLTQGTSTFRLTVTDNGGLTATDDVQVTVNAAVVESPYGGTARTIPGTIQAEDYDLGGEGLAYHDNEATNQGWQYRNDGVDIGTDEGGYIVGWTLANEWTKYMVNVATSDFYTPQVRVATPYTGKSIRIEMDGTTIGTVAIPQTGAWNVYQTVTLPNVSLAAGNHIMRLYNVTDGFNVNWVSFGNAVTNQSPTANAGADRVIALPTNSVTLSGSGSDSDGTIASYAWTKVSGSGTITTPSAASTTITGLTQGTSVFRLMVTDNQGSTATDDVTVTVNAAAVPTPYGGTARAIPGTIQVEDYDNGGEGVAYHDLSAGNTGGAYRTAEAVDVEATGDGTYDLGWTNTGEWLKYTVNVATTKTYTMQVRVATPNAGKSFSLAMDGTVFATVTLPSTGGWQTWKTVTVPNVSLTTGTHVMTLTVLSGSATDADGYNLNWISFVDNVAPTANAGADKTITLPTSSVSLAGSGTDLDGTIASYIWTKVSGTGGTIATPNAATTNITGLTAGTYTYRLKVTDNKGATATDDVIVTVKRK